MEVLLKYISKGWKDIMIGLGQTPIIKSYLENVFSCSGS